MCGITGSLNWQRPDPISLIEGMTRRLAHRGPDAEQVLAVGPIVLGHRRLAVIDIDPSSNQPMHDHTKRFWIVYNGEIYNFKKLRLELKQQGHQFKTHSDTEVILEAYKRWGVHALQHMVGMFAFALWDSKEECLLLARDRMGEKPLYYTVQQEDNSYNLVFASELSALRLHPTTNSSLNPKAISQFLSLNYILTDTAILNSVQKLPPAHYLMLKRERAPTLHSYWDLSAHFHQKRSWHSKEEASLELYALLSESVQQQSLSDVPLGAFLSGGIDSSSIVSAMKKNDSAKLTQTFSIGFNEKTYSELAESQQVANFLEVEHHTQIVDGDKAELLPTILRSMDEPFADSSLIPTYYLAKFAREKVTVCLSGDGGDELFAGYETYTADKLHQMLRFLPKKMFSRLAAMAEQYLPVTHQKVSFDYKLKQFLNGCVFDFQRAHYFWRTIFNDQEKRLILNPDYQQAVLAFDPFDSFKPFYQAVQGCHPLDQAAYVDMKTWLVDDILVKVDRTTMAHSLEARAPFLDHRLVEFAASLPVHWKMSGFQKKHILKLSQKEILPKTILSRSKKGFNAPISHWFCGKLQKIGQEVTLDTPLMQEWFHRPAIEKLWQEHLDHSRDHSLKLFGLTCLGLWMDKR